MKKRVGLFLFSLALVTTAFVSEPATAQRCQKPDCFASPGCCVAQECVEWCASRGGAPACDGFGLGGCCYCGSIES